MQNVGELFTVPASSSLLADVTCPGGTVPVGGGAHYSNVFSGAGAAGGAYISESDVDDLGSGWASTLVNGFTSPAEFTASAMCATISG